jgi:endonuclease YncB( thermonuclease family)
MTKRGRRAVTGTLAVAAGAVALWGAVVATGAPQSTPGPAASISAPVAAPAKADPWASFQRIPATVTKETDGDTIHVATAANPNLVVRIVGLNAPESVPPRPKGCGGHAASEFARNTLPVGAHVKLVIDPKVRSEVKGQVPQTDRFGRALALIEAQGGTNFSLDAVAQGYAVYNNYGTKLTQEQAFTDAQAHAQATHAGIWGTTKGADKEPNQGKVCTPETSYPVAK